MPLFKLKTIVVMGTLLIAATAFTKGDGRLEARPFRPVPAPEVVKQWTYETLVLPEIWVIQSPGVLQISLEEAGIDSALFWGLAKLYSRNFSREKDPRLPYLNALHPGLGYIIIPDLIHDWIPPGLITDPGVKLPPLSTKKFLKRSFLADLYEGTVPGIFSTSVSLRFKSYREAESFLETVFGQDREALGAFTEHVLPLTHSTPEGDQILLPLTPKLAPYLDEPARWSAVSEHLAKNASDQEQNIDWHLELVVTRDDDLKRVAERFGGKEGASEALSILEAARERSSAYEIRLPLENILPRFIREHVHRFSPRYINCFHASLNAYRRQAWLAQAVPISAVERNLERRSPILKTSHPGDLKVLTAPPAPPAPKLLLHMAAFVGREGSENFYFTKNGYSPLGAFVFHREQDIDGPAQRFFPDLRSSYYPLDCTREIKAASWR